MSKRSGNFMTVSDVVEDVGKDIIRFIMLTRKNDMVLDFDFAKVKEQSKEKVRNKLCEIMSELLLLPCRRSFSLHLYMVSDLGAQISKMPFVERKFPRFEQNLPR